MKYQAAFTLVELSMVLVVIGLLIGGVMAGQALLKGATIRAVTTEYQRYYQAVQTFRDKYQGLPGDLVNATNYWGDDATNCSDAAITNGSPGTCNGNANASIAWATEGFRAWQQLGLAKSIEGSYTGTATSTTAVIGTNVPLSKLGNAGWSFVHESAAPVSSAWNGIVLGAAVNTSYTNAASVMSPVDAYQLDIKLDDGDPDAGDVQALDSYTSCITGSSPSASYTVTSQQKTCALYFNIEAEK